MQRLERDVAQPMLVARLAAIARRLLVARMLTCIAIGFAAGAIAVTMGVTAAVPRARTASMALAAVIAAGCFAALRSRRPWTAAEAAKHAERVQPEAMNVVITGEELLRHPERASGWLRARIVSQAAGAVNAIDPARAAPLRRSVAWCAAAVALWIAAAIGVPERAISLVTGAVRDVTTTNRSGSPTIAVTITAPSYLGGTVRELKNPDKIEAVAGSHLSVSILGREGPWLMRLGTRVLSRTPHGMTDILLSESSYLAIENERSGQGERKLIPVVVTPDRAPAIRVEQPGKDLRLPDARSDVPVSAAATDDFGLTSLELRFTKVSGSGEQFEFQEGSVPLSLERDDPRSWKGRAALALSRMKLEPGDSLVYRVIGADARGGEAGTASSETFFVEIAGPGEVTVAGFELPPDRERYALSQQMIVLKIERLKRREPTMSADAVAKEAGDIAAEQRAVRANFIFLNGGEVEDEEQEAAHSHEIQEGRLAHTARQEISEATQYMSRVEKALIAVSTAGALPPAKAAVEALQRAFGRNRYILRTMPVRSRLDPARRLSGELQAAVDSKRAPHESSADPTAATARRLMGELLDLGPGLLADDRSRAQPARLSALAEEALAAGAGTAEWQRISASLLQLRDALAAGRPASDLRAHYGKALETLQAETRKSAIEAGPPSRSQSALSSSWALENKR